MDKFGGRNIGALGNIIRREWRHRAFERFESGHVSGDEVRIVESFLNDDVEHCGQNRWILAGQGLQEDMGALGRFRSAWVYDDELEIAMLDGLFETAARIVGWEAA